MTGSDTAVRKKRKWRILVIDDDAGMREVLRIYLERMGVEVSIAVDGPAGIAAVESNKHDLILSDIRMPGASGLDVLAATEKLPDPPPVILITAFPSIDTVLEAMRRGAQEYIKKPITDLDRELGRIVARVLRNRALEKENKALVGKLKAANSELAHRQAIIERELDMAGHIQRSLLPDEGISFEHLRVATRRVIGEQLSGDFYDLIPLSEGRLGVVLGQVLGRDLPAAFLMASVTGHLREMARSIEEPQELLRQTNEGIRRILERGYRNFVTAIYAVIDPRQGQVSYATSGHPAPILIDFHEELRRPLDKPEGPFLGKYADPDFGVSGCRFGATNRLVLFTENIPHIQGANKAALSVERLGRWALELGPGDTDSCASKLHTLIEHWDPDALAGKNMVLMIIDRVI